MTQSTAQPPNPLVEIFFTILLPSIALDQLSKPSVLGPFWALVVSLVFPLIFGVWCWQRKLGWNIFSILGLVTVLLSGGLGLLKLDAFWVGMKESVISATLGLAFPLTHHFGRPLIKALILQPQLINVRALNAAVEPPEKQAPYQSALYRASWGIALGMIASSVGNFFFALWLLEGKEPGSEAFVKSLGALNWAGIIVIGLPLMGVMLAVFFWLLRRIQSITGLDRDDLLNPGRTVRRQVG